MHNDSLPLPVFPPCDSGAPEAVVVPERRHSPDDRRLYDLACNVLENMIHSGHPAEDARDAVQEAVMLWLAHPVPDLTEGQRRVWLFTTANRCLGRQTWRSRPSAVSGASEDPDDAERLQQRILVRQILARCANRMTGRTRTAIRRWSLGCSSHEIAGDLGISADGVRQKIRRGLEVIRSWVRRSDPDAVADEPSRAR